MELITMCILFSFFSLFYILGFVKEDFFLELLGSLGFFIIGLLWYSTGIQWVAITDGVFSFIDIPAVGAIGIMVAVFSALLMLYLGNSLRGLKE